MIQNLWTGELIRQRIAELHHEADRQRLVSYLRKAAARARLERPVPTRRPASPAPNVRGLINRRCPDEHLTCGPYAALTGQTATRTHGHLRWLNGVMRRPEQAELMCVGPRL
jgi:hypothetical protein